jgi:hypothetical protein
MPKTFNDFFISDDILFTYNNIDPDKELTCLLKNTDVCSVLNLPDVKERQLVMFSNLITSDYILYVEI